MRIIEIREEIPEFQNAVTCLIFLTEVKTKQQSTENNKY